MNVEKVNFSTKACHVQYSVKTPSLLHRLVAQDHDSGFLCFIFKLFAILECYIYHTVDLLMLLMMNTVWSEGCSLHAVALLDSTWIDKWHQLSLPTGKWAQLPFFGASQPLEPAEWLALLILKAGDVESNPGPPNRKLPPLRPDHSDNNTQFNNTLACNHITP